MNNILSCKKILYDIKYNNAPINASTIANVSLDVTYDGSYYIISNISGMYAISGKEEIPEIISVTGQWSSSNLSRVGRRPFRFVSSTFLHAKCGNPTWKRPPDWRSNHR